MQTCHVCVCAPGGYHHTPNPVSSWDGDGDGGGRGGTAALIGADVARRLRANSFNSRIQLYADDPILCRRLMTQNGCNKQE